MEEIITKHINITENPDSLEIGTAGKGGAIKVYGNFFEDVAFKQKIEKAIEVRKYAQGLMVEPTQ
jgi:hypothetical protein